MALERPAARRRKLLTHNSRPDTGQTRIIGYSNPTRRSAWAGLLGGVLLLLMGLRGLHVVHRRSYGWLGSVGLFVSIAALVVAFAGGAFEMIDMASTGTVSTMAYLTLIVGFFILAWGSALLGLATTGTLRDPLLYLGGLLLTIAVPLGLLFVFVTGAAWNFEFWVGLTMPYGVTWMVLGYALLRAKGRAAQPRIS